jgi:HEAT repeat protein
MTAIARVLRVQPEERRAVGLVVALMFAMSAGMTIAESGINALFFDRIGTGSLPAMYLGQGATGLVAMLALTGSLARFDRRRAYVVIPVLIATVVLAERAILATDPTWIYPTLWLTVTVAQLLQAVFMWGSAGLVTDTRAAKRLFPLFGAGGILGAVVGGFSTRPLAATIGAENLLLVWAAALMGGAVLCAAALGVRRSTKAKRGRLRRRRQSALRDIGHAFSYVRRSPLLVWMTAAGVLFSVLFYSLYLPFAQAATIRYHDPEQLAGFLGIFWASVTAGAFFVSVFVTNRLLGWFGAAAMVLVLPILYAGSFGILLASSSLITLMSVRFGVNLWLQGVCSPAWETLTNVVPETRRDQVRAFLNGGPTQVGTLIAGVLALVGQQALSARQLSIIGLVVAAITIVAAWKMRRSYTGALVDALRAGRPSVFEGGALRAAPLVVRRDGQALGLALEAAGDPDPRVRRLAVEMLSADTDETRVRTVLVERTQDEDGVVRANAIRGLGLAGAIDVPILERGLADGDAAVRLSAVQALCEASSDDPAATSRLRDLVEDVDPTVAAAACAALLSGPSRDEALDRLRRFLSNEDPEVRLLTVRQIGSAAPEDVLALVRPLLDDDSPAVQAQALRALASSAPGSAVPPAIEALEHGDASVRRVAFDVLTGLDLRSHTATLLGSAQAHGRLATTDHALAASIPSDGDASELLRAALVDRGRSHALAALSTLALISVERDAMRDALDNLRGTDPGQLANALETFETSQHRSVARPLLVLWEAAGAPTNERDDWLEAISHDPDPLIVSCVELVRTAGRPGDGVARSRTSMSPMERVLELRKVPLFTELSPADLQRVARIAEERTYALGDVIAGEGELGDELHIVLTGMVAVVRGDAGTTPVARRGPGDVVGEMSILTHSPRMASLVAEGGVRTLRIGHREFESMIRERPDVALAVMRVLAERLSAQAAER